MAHHKKIRLRGRSVKRKRHRKSRKDRERRGNASQMTYEAMSPDTDIKKFIVAVIESLPEGEIHTGSKLYEGELKPLTLSDDSLAASLHSVKDKASFDNSIKEIINSLSGDELVTLHVEAHGAGERGILLSSGEILGWKEFMDSCRGLNEVLNGLLIVTLSMCNSLPILGCIDPTKRAPFKAILLTNKDGDGVDDDDKNKNNFANHTSNIDNENNFKINLLIEEVVGEGIHTVNVPEGAEGAYLYGAIPNPWVVYKVDSSAALNSFAIPGGGSVAEKFNLGDSSWNSNIIRGG